MWSSYLPILTPVGFLALKWVYGYATGLDVIVSPSAEPALLFHGEIMLPTDFFLAGLVFDATMLTMYFRLQHVRGAERVVPLKTAIVSFLLAVFWHPLLYVGSLRLVMDNASRLAEFSWEFWMVMFLSAFLAFSVPAHLVRSEGSSQ